MASAYMCQLFYLLKGSAVLEVEEHPQVRVVADDAICFAAGLRHNVPEFTANYRLIEMCIPANFDTVDTRKPGLA